MEWSDIRIFLQVAREGTMVSATAALHMDHSTISRRIARLEEKTGVRLFKRAGRRLALSAEGEKLLCAAEKLDSIIVREVLNLSSEPDRIAGPVRVGTTEEFGAHYLAPRLSAFTDAYPELEIELVAVPRTFSLAAREVDLVISLDRPRAGDVRFKKLIDVEFGVYGAARYFEDRERPARLSDFAREIWCGYIPELLSTPELDVLPGGEACSPKYRTTSITAQLSAASSGYALAALPCFVAQAHGGLERVLPGEAIFERTYWISVHEDLAKYPRVRALMTAIEGRVLSDRMLFRPPAASDVPASVQPILRQVPPVASAPRARRGGAWPDQETRRAGGVRA